jgi:CcmD family protein
MTRMIDQPQAAAPTTGGTSADDRATTFQAVSGNEAQHYSGEVLLVTAYALVWIVLLGWVAFVWRRQRALEARLVDLERVLDAAAKGPAPKAGS